MPPRAFADWAVAGPAAGRLALAGATGIKRVPARRTLTIKAVTVEMCRLLMVLLLYQGAPPDSDILRPKCTFCHPLKNGILPNERMRQPAASARRDCGEEVYNLRTRRGDTVSRL